MLSLEFSIDIANYDDVNYGSSFSVLFKKLLLVETESENTSAVESTETEVSVLIIEEIDMKRNVIFQSWKQISEDLALGEETFNFLKNIAIK